MAVTLDLMEYATDALAQAAYVTNATEGVADSQPNVTGTYGGYLGDVEGSEYRSAIDIVLGAATPISAIEIKQGTGLEGTPSGNWTLRIETASSGKPSGTLANANASVVVAPPGVGTIIKGTFSTPFTLSAGTYLSWSIQR